MWRREITVEVSTGVLKSTMKILLYFINNFKMKYYVKHTTSLFKKINFFLLLGIKRRLDNAQIIHFKKF